MKLQKFCLGVWEKLRLNVRILCFCLQVRSVHLMASERNKFAKSALFLGIASLKLFIHMLTDWCLYWVLVIIQRHGRVHITVEGWSVFCIH